MVNLALRGKLFHQEKHTSTVSIQYILKTPRESIGKYTLHFNAGKDSQKFRILNVTLGHIGSNYKCQDSLRAFADASLKLANQKTKFGGSVKLSFEVSDPIH